MIISCSEVSVISQLNIFKRNVKFVLSGNTYYLKQGCVSISTILRDKWNPPLFIDYTSMTSNIIL